MKIEWEWAMLPPYRAHIILKLQLELMFVQEVSLFRQT
jgi:hypothetical protein